MATDIFKQTMVNIVDLLKII